MRYRLPSRLGAAPVMQIVVSSGDSLGRLVDPIRMTSGTTKSLDDIIDKLQDSLQDARHLPNWSLTMIIVVTLLCIIIVIHVMALLAISPCLWAMWMRRKLQKEVSLLSEDDGVDSEVTELQACTRDDDAESNRQ